MITDLYLLQHGFTWQVAFKRAGQVSITIVKALKKLGGCRCVPVITLERTSRDWVRTCAQNCVAVSISQLEANKR